MIEEPDNTRCVDCGSLVDENGDCTTDAREHHGAPGGHCLCHPDGYYGQAIAAEREER
jgi:hypothetical protein